MRGVGEKGIEMKIEANNIEEVFAFIAQHRG
jgi:hypothetical protein